MTRKITISVPDDVADRLERAGAGKVSSYVVDAVRRDMRREDALTAADNLAVKLGLDADDLAQGEDMAAAAAAWRSNRRAA